MADNIAAKSDASTIIGTFAADEIASLLYVRNKITLGADGVNDGDLCDALPMPVKGTGTAGTAHAGVVTVQGIASMTPLQIADNGGSITVDGTVAVSGTVLVDGSATTQPVSAVSLPLPSGAATAAKQPSLGTAGTPSSDVISIQGVASGTVVPVSLASVPSHAVTNAGTFAVQADGSVAHDAADSGNPVKCGFKATTALSGVTLVSDADRTDGYAGVDGVQIVRPHCNLEGITSGVASITDGSSTSVIAAQGAGIKTYITTVIIANTSATAVTVDLRDGTAGSVKATFPVPANTSGVVCNLPVPLGFSANTAVAADPSAAASTITVTLIGFKSKV